MSSTHVAQSKFDAVLNNLKDAIVAYNAMIRPAVLPGAGAADEKIAKVVAAIKGFDSQYRNPLIEILSQIYDPALKDKVANFKETTLGRLPLAIVVPVQNPNSHVYELDRPVMVVPGTDLGMTQNAALGNNMPRPRTAYRAATDAEVRSFLDSFFASAIKTVGPDLQKAVLDGLAATTDTPAAAAA